MIAKAYRRVLKALLIVAVGAFGWQYAPPVLNAWTWRLAADDPEALTALGLKNELSPARLDAELSSALAADDVDLAASFLELAKQQNLPVSDAQREKYLAATTPSASAVRGAREFYNGAISGDGASGAGLAGVIASDLSGVGDVRDLIREGGKASRGEEPDKLVIGLAAVGLLVTGATIATIGAALPAKAGVSTIKVAAKTGRLSKPLALQIGRVVSEAVDIKAVQAAAASASRMELAAARTTLREAVKPQALSRLRGLADDVGVIGQRAGVRGAQDALAIARDGAELKGAAKLAVARGVSTRAVLKVLGRSAIVLTSSALMLAGWIMAGAGYLWLALLIAVGLTKRIARMLWWSGVRAVRVVRRASRAAPLTPAAHTQAVR